MGQPSFTLAKVKESKDQDYQRFAFIVLYVFAVVILVGWAWYEGHVEHMLKGMGQQFTIFFGVLLAITLMIGAYQGFKCSRAINEVKRIASNHDSLLAVFSIDKYDEHGFDFVCRQVDRMRSKSLRGLLFTYEVAFMVGFFGTLAGMLVATDPLGMLTVFNQDTLGPQMPTFFVGIALAVWSAIAGLGVALVALSFIMLVENSLDVLEERIDRAFYNVTKS